MKTLKTKLLIIFVAVFSFASANNFIDGTPSITFDKNGKIATNTNPHLSQNDVTNFNQIPRTHAILPVIRKYILEIASDTKINPTDKLKLERDAILLAHTMYNTEIKRVAVSDFQSRYGEYKENFEDFTSGSQSLAQAWKSITTLADAVANPQKPTEKPDRLPYKPEYASFCTAEEWNDPTITLQDQLDFLEANNIDAKKATEEYNEELRKKRDELKNKVKNQ